MTTPGNTFITAPEATTSQFEPVNTVIGYDQSKYEATAEEQSSQQSSQEAQEQSSQAAEPEGQPSKSGAVEAHRLAQLAKTERKLQQRQKEAEALIQQAEQYKGAFNSPDLIESLEKLGLKPNEIYRKLTDHALKQGEPEKAKDPMQEELDKTRAELKSYADAQKQMQSDLQAERESMAHMQAITQHVAPVIQNNQDKYETLIDVYGGVDNVIKEVYTQMYTEYQNSGTSYTAQEAADAMEQHWYNVMIGAIAKTKNLNKFKHYFRDEAEEAKKTEESANNKPLTQAERFASILSKADQETNSVAQDNKISPSKTLTNNMNQAPAPTSVGSKRSHFSPFLDKNAYIANLLKK